jgi:hypothetical protein
MTKSERQFRAYRDRWAASAARQGVRAALASAGLQPEPDVADLDEQRRLLDVVLGKRAKVLQALADR